MAFTQQQITTLESAIAEGTLSVRYADRQVTYQSLAEMRQALAQMRREVAAAAGQRPRRRTMRLFQSGTGNV